MSAVTTTSERQRLDTEVAPAGGRRRPDPDLVRSGVLALAWQGVLTVLGATIERPLLALGIPPQGPAPPGPSLLSHTFRFDATWIAPILDGSYATRPASAAFYPLFPLLAGAVHHLSFGLLGIVASALVVNTLAVWAATYALLRITRHLLGGEVAGWVAVATFLAAPTAYYLHVFYTEAVFVALAFSAYRFALERRWLAMGLCLTLLTTSRVTAVLVLGLCFLEFWRARGWRPLGLLSWPVLWFPASLMGFASYAAWLRWRTGDPFGMFTAYAIEPTWSYTRFDPVIPRTLAHQAGIAWDAVRGARPFTNYVLVDQVLPLAGLAVLVALSTLLIVRLRGAGVPLGVYGYATAVMITLNGNLVAVHRYLLPALGIYLALALLARGRVAGRALTALHLGAGLLLQSLLFALFVANVWAG